ncbi:MAG: activase, partial [Deltaproteobacteria bacterium]|nr:activase [Deltaproteobacteria bacterium]
KCASGAGEFFLQQLRRMNVSLEEAAEWSARETPYHVSGRCSVFCKSDCTHATNKGVPKSMVTAGLCKMMAGKVMELLKKVERRNVMITGGATRNRMMIAYLEKEIPGLIVPREAPYFEAAGAALWALEHETLPFPGIDNLFKPGVRSFSSLPPLSDSEHLVEFRVMPPGRIEPGDSCVLGLDVGSTTTKAVLVRQSDSAILASEYLRTNGDPVGASQRCYLSIHRQIRSHVEPREITIDGLGVCGSGRQIAGLHALTEGVVNEITAHATAAVHFDSGVDTIFEIGGQDAKYTYIVNGVPADYAMNEACSAGTGSFLEESAQETLGISMEKIASIALTGRRPPNFNDQCAAFIASDIKNAIHEGISLPDITAGLVYSICMNYNNRVKGNRPAGAKIFMQGGVCYNRAVPLAMAALTGKAIVVPPEPGLMGAFGVALEVKKRLEDGLMAPQNYDLEELSRREAVYCKQFVCKGGPEKCDRRCDIAIIEIKGEKHPFGGACNRYSNIRRKIRYAVDNLNLVTARERLVFLEEAGGPENPSPFLGTVGINKSLLVNTYYPLYSAFFKALGYLPILSGDASQVGIDRRNAAFCHPVEQAHGFFYDLISRNRDLDFIFLPHFKAMPSQNGAAGSKVCPLVQGEPFYLKAAFRQEVKQLKKCGVRILSPLLDFSGGLAAAEKPFIDQAVIMGRSRAEAKAAFKQGMASQEAFFNRAHRMGLKTLQDLAADRQKNAVVLFGRSYNAFAGQGNMGIPHKLASRGVAAIPLDFLPLDDQEAKPNMYWGTGQLVLKAAQFVRNHPQLFGVYITNFSCGPDSFLLGYFREIMGQKPSLTLELDSHTADVGVETRIEAFLDIVRAYRQIDRRKRIPAVARSFQPACTVIRNRRLNVATSSGKTLDFTDPRVKLLIPSMGQLASEALAVIFRGMGVQAVVHPPADEAILKIGRANTSCKECLPLILTTGTLLNYVQNHRPAGEVLVYFMPTTSGPCRFGQYAVFMEDLIKKNKIPDVALFSLTSENSYAGLENGIERKAWWAVVLSDVFEDMRAMLLANARDKHAALGLFREEWEAVLFALEREHLSAVAKQLESASRRFRRIPLTRSLNETPLISLAGEIFVRRDALSRQFLTECLAERGFATICAPMAEWFFYCDYLKEKGLSAMTLSAWEIIPFRIKKSVKARDEARIKNIAALSGLVHPHRVDINGIISAASPYISPHLVGEAILTVGSSLTEIVSHVCGVIAIGPFGCMPNRISEAILSETMNREDKLGSMKKTGHLGALLEGMEDLPFLAIESDGSPFPQLIQAKLETFCLQAERLDRRMRAFSTAASLAPQG